MSSKVKIQQALLTLIQNDSIGEQKELLYKLNAQGFTLTQPTLSRHLKKLNIVKKNGIYTQSITPTQSAPLNQQILKITRAEPSFIILHTLPGQATYIAFQIDQYIDYPQSERIMHDESQYINEIAGTIAGYDTVMIISKSPKQLDQVERKLQALFKL